jgi:hypothetical protein
MEAPSAPRVSILLPVFNAEKYLEKTLRSLLCQSFGDFEIVAIDDGSTDDSIEILRRFSDPRIRLERNPGNLGLIETLNRGISLCRGEFIARMDADYIALPTRLEKQVRHMQQHPRCVLVGTGRFAIDETDQPIESFNSPATGSALIQWKLLTGNFITHPTVMLRKSALPLPLFDARYKHAEDYAAWLKLSSHGDLEILSERLLQYRFHGQSVSQQNKLTQVQSAMQALADHLRAHHDAVFELHTLALWSAPQDAAAFSRQADFFRLLRWMNPLRRPFRRQLPGLECWRAFGHYHRRLLLLVISHRRRPELLLRILTAIIASPFPAR